jgi:hypothetical protein
LPLSGGSLTCSAPRTHLSEHGRRMNAALPMSILGDCCALVNSLGMIQCKLGNAVLHHCLMARSWIGYALESATDTMITAWPHHRGLCLFMQISAATKPTLRRVCSRDPCWWRLVCIFKYPGNLMLIGRCPTGLQVHIYIAIIRWWRNWPRRRWAPSTKALEEFHCNSIKCCLTHRVKYCDTP